MSRSTPSAAVALSAFVALACVAAPVAAAPAAVGPLGCLIVIDGLRGDLALRHAQDGRMPNLKRLFLDRGVWVDRATSVVPTITGAALPSILTGAFPGRHDIPSLTFFDRATSKYWDLYAIRDALKFNAALDAVRTRTVFEHFPGRHDTWAFGLPVYRGADSAITIAWTLGYKPIIFRLRLAMALRELKGRLLGGEPVRLMAFYTGWFDNKEHQLGPEAPAMEEHYAGVDATLGEIARLYEECGIFDQTYFVLVSDHGQKEFSTATDVWAHFGQVPGLPVWRPDYVNVPFLDHAWSLQPPASWEPYSLLVPAYEANAFLYLAAPLARPGDWSRAPSLAELRAYPTGGGATVDVVASCTSWAAVDFVAARDRTDGRVHVYGAGGAEGVVERLEGPSGTSYRYMVAAGAGDPLGLADEPATAAMVCRDEGDQRSFDGDAWLRATAGGERPDAPVQLCQLFDSSRAPDLFLSAREGWSLLPPSDTVSRHGALTAAEMRATLAVTGPGLAPTRVPVARTVDAVPTLLHAMGVPVAPSVTDGRPLTAVLAQLPGVAEAGAPGPASPVDPADERLRLLDECDGLADALAEAHGQGALLTTEEARELLRLLGAVPAEGRQRLAPFVRHVAAELPDPVLAAALVAALGGR